jgi:type II secretory pathway pseudopilin PulG
MGNVGDTMALSVGFPVWVALIAIALLVAITLWANQRELAFEASEARASQAELRAATAEAIVTEQTVTQSATATAVAYVGAPEAAVDRSLDLILASERDPTDDHLRALNQEFGPGALAFVRPEVEHLLSGGFHLGGDSGYERTFLASANPAPDQATVRTRERWTYDERDRTDRRVRCLIETSEQTYMLQRVGRDWQVSAIDLAASSRADCPAAA